MDKQEQGMSNDATPWFFVRFGRWISSSISRWIGWFYLHDMVFSEDESGELIQRHMARKSWFDKISSWWVESPFLVKTGLIVGFSLFSSLIGLFASAPLLFALSAMFVSFVFNTLFVCHEHSRREAAKKFAEASIVLNAELKESELFFNKATSELHLQVDELAATSAAMKGQAAQLDTQNQAIHQANEELIIIIDDVKRKTTELVVNEQAVIDVFVSMTSDLDRCDKAIAKATEQVERVGESFSALTETTKKMQKNGQIFAESVDRFSLFVNGLPNLPPLGNTDKDEFIDVLIKQNDEDEALIAQMKAYLN